MSPRYLLAAATADRPDWAGFLARLGARTGLPLVFSAPGIGAFVNARCGCLPVGTEGCVVGTLFHRHGPSAPLSALDSAASESILRSEGTRLSTFFWGGYVAALQSKGSVRILRDPSAALPCYFARGRGYLVCASDADLLVEAGLVAGEVHWRGLARHFFASGVPSGDTALVGIRELMAGFSLRVCEEEVSEQQPFWSPWDHVGGVRDRPTGGAQALARTIKTCVGAWAAGRGRLLLSVSGGLDSSIVAAALAAASADTVCLTLYGEDPSGDERFYARALCAHLGLPLVERPYRLEEIDVAQPIGAHLPRPVDRTQAQSYERAHLETAREIGACAFVTGNGGDSVFGYSQSAAAAADRYLAEGVGRGLLRTLHDISLQTGCGLVAATRAAWRIARGPSAYRCRPDPLFLHPEVLAALGPGALHHSWLDAPAGALPGKAAHIATILRIQHCLEPGRGSQLAVLNPLLSQPVIETCLAIPSWEWRAGGRDRSLARRAFAADLPPLIVGRRVKGGPDGFAAQVLDRFRARIRERLLDGRLAAHRIVERAALERVLDDPGPDDGEHRVRLLELVAAEAWLDSWAQRGRLLERQGEDRLRAVAVGSPP